MLATPDQFNASPALIVLFRDGYGFISAGEPIKSCFRRCHGARPASPDGAEIEKSSSWSAGTPQARRLVGNKTFIELPGFSSDRPPCLAVLTPGAIIVEAGTRRRSFRASAAALSAAISLSFGTLNLQPSPGRLSARAILNQMSGIFTSGCRPFSALFARPREQDQPR